MSRAFSHPAPLARPSQLPPFFITRAARRAGKRATDFEEELTEARQNSDIVSVLKVWTIEFTERHGFAGILLLASWPNAAFDMCGMACGWLEVPFWTFFGATLLGKGVIKVTLQTCVCIAVFGPNLWCAPAPRPCVISQLRPPSAIPRACSACGSGSHASCAFPPVHTRHRRSLLLSVIPAVSLPAAACKAVGGNGSNACTFHSFLVGGRQKMMYKFSLQRRMAPTELLGAQTYLTERNLLDKYCGVMTACGEQYYSGSWSNAEQEVGMAAVAKRVMRALDANDDGKLMHDELTAAVGSSDGALHCGICSAQAQLAPRLPCPCHRPRPQTWSVGACALPDAYTYLARAHPDPCSHQRHGSLGAHMPP